ncbi:MAG TPA: Yip1 family protein [Ignavibacteriales bacterium]|nr:Yip1 family protein [Ignavibacteriales bacterium]
MDDIHNPEPVIPEQTSESFQEEPSHSDKLAGVFLSPAQTYEQMSKFPPRVIDWLLPVSLMIIFAIIANVIIMNNPDIRYEVQQKQMAQLEKTFNQMVEKGQLTREAADEQLDKNRERMEQFGSGGIGTVLQAISTVFAVFITFFIVTGIYFLFSRFVLKGEGTYMSALSANGLSYYISIVGLIAMILASLFLRRFMMGTSLGAFMNMDKSTFAGLLMYKLDLFGIWGLAVTSVGLSKMFHSKSMGKYFAVVFGIWIVWSFIAFGIASAVPALSFLNM